MDTFDLNINNYNIQELQTFFNLTSDYSIDDIYSASNKIKNKLLSISNSDTNDDSFNDNSFKDSVLIFIKQAETNLLAGMQTRIQNYEDLKNTSSLSNTNNNITNNNKNELTNLAIIKHKDKPFSYTNPSQY